MVSKKSAATKKKTTKPKEEVATSKKAVKRKIKKPSMVKKSKTTKLSSPFEKMETLFDDYFARRWARPFHIDLPEFSKSLAAFEGKTPTVDVIDRGKNIVVKAELPGVDKKDIDISITNNTVTIRATTSSKEEEEKGDYYHSEISQGSFSRSLSLPSEVDENKTSAKFKNGVLELTMVKINNAKRRNITIK